MLSNIHKSQIISDPSWLLPEVISLALIKSTLHDKFHVVSLLYSGDNGQGGTEISFLKGNCEAGVVYRYNGQLR